MPSMVTLGVAVAQLQGVIENMTIGTVTATATATQVMSGQMTSMFVISFSATKGLSEDGPNCHSHQESAVFELKEEACILEGIRDEVKL
jgi:hypothetical protein